MKHIDLETDTLVPVQQLCKERFGRRISPSTLWRWTRKGCRGVKLEAVLFCAQWCTTPSAFAAFLEERSNLPSPRTAEQERRDEEEMDRRLREAGLL